MSKSLHIDASTQTPEITFDFENGTINISGKSYPENVLETYSELFKVLEDYKKEQLDETTVNFRWLYYNTATSKIIVKIVQFLKSSNKSLIVNWYCDKEFILMIERANLFGEVLDLKFNIIHPE